MILKEFSNDDSFPVLLFQKQHTLFCRAHDIRSASVPANDTPSEYSKDDSFPILLFQKQHTLFCRAHDIRSQNTCVDRICQCYSQPVLRTIALGMSCCTYSSHPGQPIQPWGCHLARTARIQGSQFKIRCSGLCTLKFRCQCYSQPVLCTGLTSALSETHQ